MRDERDIENRVERVPASPGSLVALREFFVRSSSEGTFETTWREYAAQQIAQSGCQMLRLHHDSQKADRFISFEHWKSAANLTATIRRLGEDIEFSGDSHQLFLRPKVQIMGAADRLAGQFATVRRYYLKVGSEGEFESLWRESARQEARQADCIYKHLYRDLNLPTLYISYSLWVSASAPDEAASKHAHYQQQHKLYPLVRAVTPEKLELLVTQANR